jgi:hypothetical protein
MMVRVPLSSHYTRSAGPLSSTLTHLSYISCLEPAILEALFVQLVALEVAMCEPCSILRDLPLGHIRSSEPDFTLRRIVGGEIAQVRLV